MLVSSFVCRGQENPRQSRGRRKASKTSMSMRWIDRRPGPAAWPINFTKSMPHVPSRASIEIAVRHRTVTQPKGNVRLALSYKSNHMFPLRLGFSVYVNIALIETEQKCLLCITSTTLALNGFYGYWYGDVKTGLCGSYIFSKPSRKS